MSFERMWRELLPIGRSAETGGYRRSPFASAEAECVAWYVAEATSRGLEVRWDRYGNAVAWWRPDGVEGLGVLIGSHLDSVHNGGAFDGPLGIVSSFAAVDQLRDASFTPRRPLGIALFREEEGSRFGVACLGSQLATGRMTLDRAAQLQDRDGVYLLDALAGAGVDLDGGEASLLADVDTFVELHVEQGRDLVDRGRPVALGSASWAHGRWRFDFTGEPNHAGATRMEDRHDPMLSYAMTVLAANKQARLAEARATFGRVSVVPNSTNAIPERVSAWLDARAEDAVRVEALVDTITRQAVERTQRDGTDVNVTRESVAPTVEFDRPLAGRLSAVLDDAPLIATGAGHDAAILQLAGVATAMIFVRNPTGISHSPEEFAELEDCLSGVAALATVVTELTS